MTPLDRALNGCSTIEAMLEHMGWLNTDTGRDMMDVVKFVRRLNPAQWYRDDGTQPACVAIVVGEPQEQRRVAA